MEASYAYPSAQSWLQAQGTCQLCGSNGYLLSGRELKAQIDVIQTKQKDVLDLAAKANSAKVSFTKAFSVSEVDNNKIISENLKKELKRLSERKEKDSLILHDLEVENGQYKKLLEESKKTLLEKEHLLSLKKVMANDLRLRLKELSNVLFVERMKRALAIFKMMAIIVSIPSAASEKAINKDGRSVSPNPRSQQLSGCSSILSLPLPNNGIYSDIPSETTAVALSHIAHLVDSLSGALNIPVLHPIVLVNATECMISPHYNLSACYSLSPLIHINTRAKHRSFLWLTPAELRKSNVGKRSDSAGGEADTTDYMPNKAFPQALTLLQADIVALCLRAGLSPDAIWPPQAMLLNLHELLVLCARCVKRNSAPPSQSILQTTKAKGSEVELPLPRDAVENRQIPAVPLVFQLSEAEVDDPVVASLSQRYSASVGGGVGSSRAYGSVSLPGVTTDELDEVVLVEKEEQEETPLSVAAVRPVSGAVSKVKKADSALYDEGGYGLSVVEEEYDMLDLLLESQMLAERNTAVDTNNENELWP